MDEALVPHVKRLRIGRSNFPLLSEIKSKESTLQLVYDVLRLCPFFKAFLVTADVPEIYMQEFWVTATVHHHAIRFKMDNKKHIINLESFRLHICPRVHGQSFAEPPFEEEIIAFIRFLRHIATGAAPPKPKASVRKTRSSSDTTITSPTAAAGTRLTTSQKDEGTGSISGVLDVPTDVSEEELSWNSTEDEGDDEGKDGDDDDNDDNGNDGEEGDGDDDDEDDDGEEGDDDDDQEVEKDNEKDDDEEGGDDEQEYDKEEYDEETRDDESFDPIWKTLENSNDEGNSEKDLGLNVGREEGHDEEEEKMNYTETSILIKERMNEAAKVAVQIQSDRLRDEAQRENDEFLKTVDEKMQKIIKEQVKEQVKVQFSKILPRIEQTVNEQLEAKVLTRSSHSSKTSYAVAVDLSEMELKKILISKMEGNKSIQRSNEQRNLYKALVEAYESDKIILDTYEETVTLKRRRDDDADKDEEPSAGPDRGSKRCREGKEPGSASAPKEKATRSVGKSTQGSKSRQALASESALAEEPMQTTF
nr:hypothetical protein [Tanacetum cinerariifolium]